MQTPKTVIPKIIKKTLKRYQKVELQAEIVLFVIVSVPNLKVIAPPMKMEHSETAARCRAQFHISIHCREKLFFKPYTKIILRFELENHFHFFATNSVFV